LGNGDDNESNFNDEGFDEEMDDDEPNYGNGANNGDGEDDGLSMAR
jgi:hypothetical protein